MFDKSELKWIYVGNNQKQLIFNENKSNKFQKELNVLLIKGKIEYFYHDFTTTISTSKLTSFLSWCYVKMTTTLGMIKSANRLGKPLNVSPFYK